MSKKEQFTDGEIDDLFSKVEIPLEKDKDLVWSEKFESLARDQSSIPSKNTTVFRFLAIWDRGFLCHTSGCHFLYRFPKLFYRTSQGKHQGFPTRSAGGSNHDRIPVCRG